MDTNSPKLIKWNPTTAEYNKNPYISFKECLEHNPVQHNGHGEWILFRYEHVKQMLKEPTTLTMDLPGFFEKKEDVVLKNTNQCPFLARSTKQWLLYLNGDEHRESRELADKVLKSYDLDNKVKECLEEWFTNFFLDDTLDMAYVAWMLPALIFRSLYQPVTNEWSSLANLNKVSDSVAMSLDMYISIKQYQQYNADTGWLFDAISKDFENNNLGENALVSNFIRINEEMGSPFTKDELVSLTTMLFFTSIETTVDAITNSINEFFKNPELLDYILKADAKQINILVEELFRFASPVQYTIRINTQPVEIGGHLIPENSKIYGCLASANRDPSVFENPDTIIPDRNNNPHIAFGTGSHVCLGAKLARMELRALLKPLAEILKNYRFDENRKVEWQKAILLRGVKNIWSVKK